MAPIIKNPLLLDANLLLIAIICRVDVSLIGKAKRTKEYDEQDVALLANFLENSPSLVVTPYVFAETSNLLGIALERGHLDTARVLLAELAQEHRESRISLKEASQSCLCVIGGITDAALFEIARTECCTLLTVDSKLHAYSQQNGASAVNFNHYRH